MSARGGIGGARPPGLRRLGPAPLWLLTLPIAAFLLLPLAFVLQQASSAGAQTALDLLRLPHVGELLRNTLELVAIVPPLCAVIGAGAAWLLERTDIPARRLWAVVLALPLAVPEFVNGYALGRARRPRARPLGRRAREHALVLPARHAPGHGELPARRLRARGRRAQPGAAAARGLRARHAAAVAPRPAGRRADHRAAPAGRVRRVRAARLPHVHDRDLHRVPARVRRGVVCRAFARPRRALSAAAGRRVDAAGPHCARLGQGRSPAPLAPRPAHGARDALARRPRRARHRRADRRARLLARGRQLHHAAARLDHRRGHLDRRPRARRGRHHHARRDPGRRARHPLSDAPGPPRRAQHLHLARACPA